MAQFILSAASKRNSDGVDQGMLATRDLALKISPIDFGHPQYAGLRTVEIQRAIYLDGKSKADGIIHRSRHQDGEALDFFAFVDGKASWNPHHLAVVAASLLQAGGIIGYPLEWGGFWIPDEPKIIDGIQYGWDCGHVQKRRS